MVNFERIRELRISKGISQKRLADDIDVHLRAIENYEHNKQRPVIDILIKLANYFNVSLDYLCGLTDNPERK